MTDYDLYGPWTGNALHAPRNHRKHRRPHLFVILALLAVVTGTLIAIN